MLLKELFEEKGTYAGLRFSTETIKIINKICDKFNISSNVPNEKLHSTLLFSRKYLPNYEPKGEYNDIIVGKPVQCNIWKFEDDNALVLQYDCEEQVKRHESLMKEHGGTWDHDNYIPHVTLSYDVGEEFDLKELNDCVKSEPFDIEIVSEYHEDLDLDWTNNNLEKENE